MRAPSDNVGTEAALQQQLIYLVQAYNSEQLGAAPPSSSTPHRCDPIVDAPWIHTGHRDDICCLSKSTAPPVLLPHPPLRRAQTMAKGVTIPEALAAAAGRAAAAAAGKGLCPRCRLHRGRFGLLISIFTTCARICTTRTCRSGLDPIVVSFFSQFTITIL